MRTFEEDLLLILENCKMYNRGDKSPEGYYAYAAALEKALLEQAPQLDSLAPIEW